MYFFPQLFPVAFLPDNNVYFWSSVRSLNVLDQLKQLVLDSPRLNIEFKLVGLLSLKNMQSGKKL